MSVVETSSLYTHFTCFNTKNVNFLLTQISKVFILKYNKFKCYWAAVTEKTSNSVYREEPFLSAQILDEKSAFSPATVVFEK